jgi:alkylation response protein AidB-like acyl-CoA dehydrogenase
VHRLSEPERALIEMVREVATERIAPAADHHERAHTFPRELFDLLAGLDLTGLPFAPEVGGSGISQRTYLMVVEEVTRAFAALGMGLSVHTLATWGIDTFATPAQRQRFVPDLVAGKLLGAYSLSETGSGSDAAALMTRAVRDGDDYRLTGTKAWVTHGGVADRYLVMART